MSPQKREKYVGCSDLSQDASERKTIWSSHCLFFLRADNELYQTINSGLIRLEYFDIFKDSKEHLERLKDYQPTIVVAPASTLIELANYVSNQQLAIQPVKVVSVAEILEERDAETIAKSFQLDTVDQVYQATEGFLACTCSEGNLHLNEDILYVEKEYLDDSRFYPDYYGFQTNQSTDLSLPPQ